MDQIHNHRHSHSATAVTATAPLKKIVLPISRSTISYTSEGDTSADLVFVALHGGPGSHKDFKYISQKFVDEKMIESKHSMIRFDLPGYGESTEFPSTPTSHNYASSVIEALELIVPKDKKIVLIGHSLGGHIAMSVASSKKINTAGLLLLASVACRPHKALGDRYGYPISRWLGLNTRNRYFGSLVCMFLDYVYRKFYGFPKSSKTNEIVWTQERVAYLDWNEFTQQTKDITCPVTFFYAKNDHLLQVERFEELAALISSKRLSTVAAGHNRVIVFEDGGHNIQKTKASEIGKEVNDWILSILHKNA